MAFNFDVNNIIGANGGAEALYLLMSLLKTVGWDVPSSGDGLALGPAGDNISHAGAGAGGMNNNNAWFRIRAPAGMSPRREYVFQRGTTNRSVKGFYSAEDTFIGGAPSSTVLPTATDEGQIVGTGGAFDTTFMPAASGFRFHIGADDADPYGWYAFSAINGTGLPATCMLFDPMDVGTYNAADQDPCINYFNEDSATPPFALSRIESSVTGPWGWYNKDGGGEAFARMPGCNYNNSSGDLLPGNVGTNPYDSDDNHFPIPYGRQAVLVSSVGWKGFGSVMRWLGGSRGDMDTLSTGGTKDYVVVRNCVLPWPDVVPNV